MHTALLSRKRKKSATALTTAASTIEIVKNATDSLPFLSVATGIALIIVNKLLAVTENIDDCEAIAERIVQVFLTIADTFRDIDPNDISAHTSRRIDSLQRCLEGLLHRVDKLASKPKWKRYLMPEKTKSDLGKISTDLDNYMQLFQISSLISLQLQTEPISSCATRRVHDVAPECPEIMRKEFDLFDLVLLSKGEFDVYGGSYGTKLIAIKCFKGHDAKTDWALHLEHDRQDMYALFFFFVLCDVSSDGLSHPNTVTVIGKSTLSESMPYIVYDGIRGNTEQQLATLLTSNLEDVVGACVSFIYGLSAGLLRLDDRGIPLTKLGAENIHVFLGPNNRTILSVDWSEAKYDDGSPSPCTLLDILDSIAIRVYQTANRLRYDDWTPEEVSEPSDTIELIEADSNAHRQTASDIARSEAPDSERGLVWKKSEVDVVFDLASVRDNAMRLHQGRLAGVALTASSRKYRDIGQLDRQNHTREEVTFSARVVDYKIISRIILQQQKDEEQQIIHANDQPLPPPEAGGPGFYPIYYPPGHLVAVSGEGQEGGPPVIPNFVPPYGYSEIMGSTNSKQGHLHNRIPGTSSEVGTS
ncbi:hypothetical protein BDZ89DRAFT_1162355 [Hymenopellis radicata]|nr:hypothetical protein BDZ89DRAFT_1162355 [Hymenopellis radicata]